MRRRARTERRDLHGLLVLAKPAGPSSNAVLQEARRLLGGPKAGHAGTLDPAASGVLLLLLGEGTKLAPFLADLAKEYRGVARFGAATDTEDAEGRVTATAAWDHVDEPLLRTRAATFVGESLQLPPMYSAVQVGGERLYRLAREGREVERASRAIVVSEFRILAWRPPEAEFLVRCSSGTYVRTLVRELGERCASAAHLAELERTAVGSFRLAGAATLGDLAALAPGEAPPGLVGLAAALRHLPAVVLDDEGARAAGQGRPPGLGPGDVAPGATVRLLDPAGRLLAVARAGPAGAPPAILRGFRT